MQRPQFILSHLVLLTFALYLSILMPLHSLDLEERTSSFVLDLKQINLPNHPHAFNPSIVSWNDLYLVCFREIINDQSFLGIIELNDNFEPMGEAQILNDQINSYGLEDGRLVVIDRELYLIYSACPPNLPIISISTSGGNCRMYSAKLTLHDSSYVVKEHICIESFEGQNPKRREKNWVPFDYQGHLFFAYSLNPHRIFSLNKNEHACDTISLTEGQIYWPWGELRGGTPALLCEGYYISFFHSSTEISSDQSDGQIVPHYFMGAYLFNSSPPFNIVAISQDPIIARGFYSGNNYPPYWHPVRVIFPYGLIQTNDYFYVSYGRQDHEMWIATIDKKAMMNSLKNVMTF